jgi:hypothetical protein
MIEAIGEDRTKDVLCDFSCPLNKDVEYFLRSRAIEFSKQGLSKTHLVFTSYKDRPVLCGYFTLCYKIMAVSADALSSCYKKRIQRFGKYNRAYKQYDIPAPLIAQLGKNYTNGYDKLICGDEMLKIAIDNIMKISRLVGGKFIYLECEDEEALVKFYSDNGFVNFGKRVLDKEEEDRVQGRYLIQMLRYLE